MNYLLSDFPTVIIHPGSSFDPTVNALDFWESMEHMRVVLMEATVSGPKTKYGELAVRVPQRVTEPATARGGVKLVVYDFNPVRVLVALSPDNEHKYSTGDRIADTIHGNLTYSFGNYKIGVSKLLSAPQTFSRQPPVQAIHVPESAFKFASFNVENLYTELPDTKFESLAKIITDSLQSADIIALQKTHDDSGPTSDGIVDASETLKKLACFIENAGAPRYNFHQLNPEDKADGGWPGANIRNAYLYKATLSLGKSYLLKDPAFVANKAINFLGTRKPLVALFNHGDQNYIFINCHLRSKGGDSPSCGTLLPQIQFPETQRIAQTRSIRAHVETLQKDHPDAKIILLGDMNDYEFSPAIENFTRNGGLTNLVDTEPITDRYTYVFNGFSQVLDHILVSEKLASKVSTQIIPVNSDLSEGLRASDHDPILAWLHSP